MFRPQNSRNDSHAVVGCPAAWPSSPAQPGISAVKSVDDREIPHPGPITTAIAKVYIDAANGKVDQYKDWNELAV